MKNIRVYKLINPKTGNYCAVTKAYTKKVAFQIFKQLIGTNMSFNIKNVIKSKK